MNKRLIQINQKNEFLHVKQLFLIGIGILLSGLENPKSLNFKNTNAYLKRNNQIGLVMNTRNVLSSTLLLVLNETSPEMELNIEI